MPRRRGQEQHLVLQHVGSDQVNGSAGGGRVRRFQHLPRREIRKAVGKLVMQKAQTVLPGHGKQAPPAIGEIEKDALRLTARVLQGRGFAHRQHAQGRALSSMRTSVVGFGWGECLVQAFFDCVRAAEGEGNLTLDDAAKSQRPSRGTETAAPGPRAAIAAWLRRACLWGGGGQRVGGCG